MWPCRALLPISAALPPRWRVHPHCLLPDVLLTLCTLSQVPSMTLARAALPHRPASQASPAAAGAVQRATLQNTAAVLSPPTLIRRQQSPHTCFLLPSAFFLLLSLASPYEMRL